MNQTLSQKKNLETRTFSHDGQSLKISFHEWKEERSWEIKLDKIGYQKYYRKESKKPRILIGILIGIAFVVINTLAFISTVKQNWGGIILGDCFMLFICGLMYFKKPVFEISIMGGEQDVVFFGDSPDSTTVEKYIDNLIACSSEFILKKYGKIDVDLPEETQMNILHWLKSRELISEDEYEKLKREYKIQRLL